MISILSRKVYEVNNPYQQAKAKKPFMAVFCSVKIISWLSHGSKRSKPTLSLGNL